MSAARTLVLIVLGLVSTLLASRRLSAAPPDSPRFLREWGRPGEADGEFHSPIGIAFNARDELLVTDLNNARVQRFRTDGTHLATFGVPRDKEDRKSTMLGGIAIDGDGLVYLTYMVQHQVAVYRETGELVREFGREGAGPGEFRQPGGIVVTPEGELLIADQCNHRVQRLKRTGEFVAEWGGHGVEPGQFDGLGTKGSRFGGPHFIARDRRGRLFTTEGIQGRVQIFDAAGSPLGAWGNKEDGPGGFGAYQFGGLEQTVGPIGIAIDEHDRVFVSSLNNRVQCFDTGGRFLFGIESTGLEGGELLHPHGMAFDRAGRLYICDAGNQRIVLFELPAAAP